MFLLCHLWFTTTNFFYRCPILETSATPLCGTTGQNDSWLVYAGLLDWFESRTHVPNQWQMVELTWELKAITRTYTEKLIWADWQQVFQNRTEIEKFTSLQQNPKAPNVPQDPRRVWYHPPKRYFHRAPGRAHAHHLSAGGKRQILGSSVRLGSMMKDSPCL